ncbi:MAG: prolyl oligopeptidase family serine peptidase [Phycisphaerae bacterium]|nr:prolyl oligopeptidase family serine peptidase [Phycisphaerae bacterium]
MYWVDLEGNRHPYDRLAPGGTASQHTFAGHVWVGVGHDGRELAWFRAEARPSIGVVNNPAPKPPEYEDEIPDGASAELEAWALNGTTIEMEGAASAITDREAGPASAAPAFEPFIKDFNVWGRDPSGQEFPLSTDGSPNDPYDGRFFWSPDAARLIAMRTTKGGDRKVTYIESTPTDQLQPRVKTYEYLKPGDDIPLSRPRLFDAAARTQIPVDESLFSNPWSADNFRWEPDSSRFTFLYNQRGHTVMRVISIDAGGKVLALVNEECTTFFDYAAKTFLYFTRDSRLIWMSERTGWNHLELRDKGGTLLNQITTGKWVVRSVERVDEDTQQITFKAMGIRPGQDPYHVHLARVNFDGTGLTLLTEGDGTHEVVPSPTGEYLIDTYSRADLPPVTELRRASDGTLIVELERADWSALLEAGWRAPERFVAKGRDGATDIHGLIHRPTNFDPIRKYPVVEAIYAGPHDQHVPKGFRAYSQCNEIAELGFIVVQIDGMGTNWRSKAFHDVAWKNLKDAGFPDRVLWMRAAAAAHPEMDLVNHGRGVGIYGGSAGGQNAMGALLWHGDFYKAAVADCGCHDNRMDKVWWNELWMSWPIGPWYEASSNAANASRLPDDCKLLLTVGEMDENVDPASTMQVVSRLVRANKDFEMLVLPGEGHGAAETPYGRKKRQDFFVRHLLGREPRWE